MEIGKDLIILLSSPGQWLLREMTSRYGRDLPKWLEELTTWVRAACGGRSLPLSTFANQATLSFILSSPSLHVPATWIFRCTFGTQWLLGSWLPLILYLRIEHKLPASPLHDFFFREPHINPKFIRHPAIYVRGLRIFALSEHLV